MTCTVLCSPRSCACALQHLSASVQTMCTAAAVRSRSITSAASVWMQHRNAGVGNIAALVAYGCLLTGLEFFLGRSPVSYEGLGLMSALSSPSAVLQHGMRMLPCTHRWRRCSSKRKRPRRSARQSNSGYAAFHSASLPPCAQRQLHAPVACNFCICRPLCTSCGGSVQEAL